MELTQKRFVERLERLQKIAKEAPGEFSELADALHEKGVECAVIVPLLEVVLDFDALRGVHYEKESRTKLGQRFDFLLDGRFLVEAKALGANLDEHYQQMTRYIQKNDDISYGILTNGIDYQIWLQRSYVQEHAKAELPHAQPVMRVFDVTLQEDSVPFLLDALSIFRRDAYQDSFRTIASIVAYYGAGGRGRPANVHEDRAVNEALRERIRDAVTVTKGVFYDDVVNGKVAPGDKLTYADDCVAITVQITPTGTVTLGKGDANVVDMVRAIKEGWAPMIAQIADHWSKADAEFSDPLEIIKLALNKQRLFNKERYEFKPIHRQA